MPLTNPPAFSADGGSSVFNTLSFSNANGISFSNSNGQVAASHNALTSQSNQNVTAGNGGFSFQTLSFSNLNGISFGTSAGSAITASHNALTSQSNQALSAANGSFAFQTASFSNANGVSFVTAAGSAIQASVETSYAASNHSHGNPTLALTNLSGTTASASNGFTLSLSAAAGGGGDTQMTAYATGNTTQSSTGTVPFSSWIVRGSNIVSAGVSNGSIIVDATQSNQAFSAAGGSSAFQTLGFSDNAYASWTNTNGSVAIAELRGSFFATSNTTQSSSGTINLDSVIFQGAGIASVGVSNGSVVISVPSGGGAGDGGVFAGVSTGGNTAGSTGTVSTGNFVLVGSNGITLSQSTGGAGSAATVTVLGDGLTNTLFNNVPFGALTSAGFNASLIIAPEDISERLEFDHLLVPYHFSQATNSTMTVSITVGFAVYTRNASTLSSYASTSSSYSINGSGTVSSSLNNGVRLYSIPFTSTLTKGRYWFAHVYRTSTAGVNASFNAMRPLSSGSNWSGFPGVATNASQQYVLGAGFYSSTTTIPPASIPFTSISGGNIAFNSPRPFMLVSSTV